MKEEPLRVLLVEDEASLREPLAGRLRQVCGYQVDTAATGAEAWERFAGAGRPYDVALIDDLLVPEPGLEPEPIGIKLLAQIKERCPETECIIFTGWGMNRALEALQAGAYRYLTKPLNLEELGITIRLAVEQARIRRERDLLSITLEISNALVSGLDLEQVLRGIAEAAPGLIGAEACAVGWLDPVTAQVSYYPAMLGADLTVRWTRHLKQGSLTRHIIQTGELFMLSDVDARADEVDDHFRRAGIKSLVGVPIPGEPDPQGVLYAYSTRPEHFGRYERKVLELLTNQVAIALKNARLFQAEAQRRQEAETLREVALTLTTTRDPQESLERVLTELQKLIPYDSASIQLLRGEFLEILGGRGFSNPAEIIGLSFPVDGSHPNREVVESRECVIIPDAPARYEAFRQEPHAQLGIRSWLGAPMLIGERLLGMITLDKREPGFYSPEHARLASVFATQAALAIENSRLFEENQTGLKQLRSLYEAGSAIISAADPKRVLEIVVEEACRALEGWRAKVVLISDKGEPVDLAAVGFETGLDTGDLVRYNGISARVRASGTPWTVDDAQKTPDGINPLMLADGVRAAACVPFGLLGRNMGAMWIHYREPRRFSSMEIEALRLSANQAAIAYDNAWRMRELEHFHHAAQKLAGAASIDEVLHQIVKSARQVLHADSVVIWSYDAVRHTFLPDQLIAEGIHQELVDEFRKYEPRPGGTGQIVMERKYLQVTDTDAPEFAFIGPPGRGLRGIAGSRAFQGIALRVGDETLGILYVNYKQPRDFSAEDKIALESFANHAALTLKKARLLEQVSRARDTAKIVAQVSVLENLDTSLDSIVKGTYEALNCDAVSLYTYDEARDQFGFPPAMFGVFFPGEVLKLGSVDQESVVHKILTLNEAYVAEDAPADPIVAGPFVTREGIKSSVSIPLHDGRQKVGVMFVNYRSRHRFTSEELSNIELFSNQAAVAIANARLYERLRQANDDLKRTKWLVAARTALAWIGMASSAWRHTIEKHTITIKEQNQLLQQDLDRIRPRLENPKIAGRIAKIERLTTQILEKDITPPLSTEAGVDWTSLTALAGERARQLWQSDPYKKVALQLDLQLPDNVTVRLSPEWLRRAFDILVDNAVNAIADSDRREIVVGTRRSDGGAEIFVSDTGPGIPEDVRAKIGLELIEKPEDARGLGMGLLMAQTIVQTYGGEIRVAATGPTGTTMVVWFPL